MREIKLTKDQIANVSDAKYEMVNSIKWYAQWSENTKGYYAIADIKGEKVCMHRYIMGLKKGDKQVIHHIDHNGLNNDDTNLKVVSAKENSYHRKKHAKNNKSLYKGVWKYFERWRACIMYNGKHISLGYFDTQEQAAKAYDAKALELFGEFACLNFPL